MKIQDETKSGELHLRSESWEILGIHGDQKGHRGQFVESEGHTRDVASSYFERGTNTHRKNSGAQSFRVPTGGKEFPFCRSTQKRRII